MVDFLTPDRIHSTVEEHLEIAQCVPAGDLVDAERRFVTHLDHSQSVVELPTRAPSPLAIGTIALEDGTSAIGFLCESAAADAAPDISSYGSWRAYLADVRPGG